MYTKQRMRRTKKQQWGDEEIRRRMEVGEERREGKKEGRKEGKKRGMEWRRPPPEKGGHVPGVTVSVCLLVYFRVFLALIV